MKFFLAILLTVSGTVWSQNASPEGVVTDPSSGVIISASVTATESDTGVRHTARTNSAGEYAFPSLCSGTVPSNRRSPRIKTHGGRL